MPIPYSNQSVVEYHISPVFEWERNFKWSDTGPWMYEHFPYVVAISILYLVLVFAGQHWMKSRAEFGLTGPLIAWNGFLTVLSWVMAIRLVPALIARLIQWPLHQTICDTTFPEGTTGLWIFIFAASKLPELLDTLFLVLRKKPVILLHWYHHFTVLLFTWFSFSIANPGGLWFSAMNSFVHAFMYLYYFETSRGKRPSWNMIITIIQILQMIAGSTITIVELFSENPCARPVSIYTGAVMYFSYFCLFVHLFYESYCSPNAKKKRTGKGAKGGARVAAVGNGTATTPATNGTATPSEPTDSTVKKDL